MKHTIVWFEIPVKDLKRAINFYSTVMGMKMAPPMEMGPLKMAFFSNEHGPEAVSGALVESPDHVPSTKGTLIYLNGGDDLSAPLKRVVKAGGKIVKEKMSIGQYGFMAVFEDTEGNRVALHSMS